MLRAIRNVGAPSTIVVAITALLLLVGCGGGTPDPGSLPLPPGLQVVAHEAREGVDAQVPPANILLIVGPKGTSAEAMRAQELAYLRQQGWKAQAHNHDDGSWEMQSADGSLWGDIGFDLSGFCNFDGERQTFSGRPTMCSSLGESQN
jgi:hypothetical protein